MKVKVTSSQNTVPLQRTMKDIRYHQEVIPKNCNPKRYKTLHRCQECKFTSFSLNHVKAHIEMQHDSKLDPLNNDDLDNPKDDSLNESMNSTWIKTEIVDDDPIQINNISNQNKSGQEPIDDPLDVNSYIFDNNDNNHKEHNSLVNEKKRHTCGKCGKTFGRNRELNRHYFKVCLNKFL